MQMFTGIKLTVPQLCSRLGKHRDNDQCVSYKLVSTYSPTASQLWAEVFSHLSEALTTSRATTLA